MIDEATAGMTNVLESAASCQVERIILTSSSVTLGASPRKRVINETTTEKAGDFQPYAESKRQQLDLAIPIGYSNGTGCKSGGSYFNGRSLTITS